MTTSTLRYEPVGCVLTVVAAEHGDVHVMDMVSRRTEVVLLHDSGAEHFSEIYGSLVYVGALCGASLQAAAAIVIDLPGGRIRAAGTASIDVSPQGVVAVTILAPLESGSIRIRAHCTGAAFERRVAQGPLRSIS